MSKEESLERFNFDFRQLQKKFGEKYDESTAVVINESGYKVGDMFPEIRGLMHIKNDTELQVFKESRSNILVALWSNKCKDLNKFLEVIDNLAHQKKVKSCYAINVDRVFLYN